MKKTLIILLSLLISACATTQNVAPNTTPATQNSDKSDKNAIINKLNTEVNKKHNLNVSLKAQYLKIKNNWAYVETTGGGDPSVNAVLHKVNNQWILPNSVNPCDAICPANMSDCADGEKHCKYSLAQRFPNAPASIFPSASAYAMVIN